MVIERYETFSGTQKFTMEIDWVLIHDFNKYVERQLNIEFKPILLGDVVEYFEQNKNKEYQTSGLNRMHESITAANGYNYYICDVFNDWLENYIYNKQPDIDIDEVYDIEDKFFL